jgi:uncharacterized protein (DUF488 family)
MSLLPEKEIFTIGHSTRTLEEFVTLLCEHDIGCLIDARIAPGSRRMPHFAKQSLAEALHAERIAYVHMPRLGGRRRPARDSANAGWKNTAFRGYADHMATQEFAEALDRLTDIAEGRRSATMCAEALWWRCHRMLISDALTVKGWRVVHIGAGPRPQPHRLTPFAVVAGESLSYPAAQGALPLES